jgi:NAD(P)-dependent dehydrogenase (short-subunit alcohol dehydrogenase family)
MDRPHSTARVSDGRRCDGRCCCKRGTRSKRAGHDSNRQRAKGIGGQANARAFAVAKFCACGAGTRIQPLGKSRGRDGRRARDRPGNCGRTGRERRGHRRDRHRRTCFSRLQRPPATPEELDETAKMIRAFGRRAETVRADIRDIGALRRIAEETDQQFGKIDILVANAAIQRWKPHEGQDRKVDRNGDRQHLVRKFTEAACFGGSNLGNGGRVGAILARRRRVIRRPPILATIVLPPE